MQGEGIVGDAVVRPAQGTVEDRVDVDEGSETGKRQFKIQVKIA